MPQARNSEECAPVALYLERLILCNEGSGLSCAIGTGEAIKPDGRSTCKNYSKQYLCPDRDVRYKGVLGAKCQGVVQ